MSNLKDFKNKNTEFTGTAGIDLPEGTTAQRVNTQGNLRYNTETQLAEYYATNWKSIDSPPSITGISPTSIDSDGSTLFDITITGDNFQSGATVKFIGNDNTEYTSGTVTINSITSITAKTTATMTVANEPYTVRVTNISGLSSTSSDSIDAGAVPNFLTSAGSLGTLVKDSAMTAQVIQANDPDSTQIKNMSVTAGALPSGTSGAFTWDGNNGNFTITGTPDTAETATFTITATDGTNTSTREFSFVVAVADGSSEALAAVSPAALTSAGVTANGNRWFKPTGQTQAHQLYFEGTTGYARLGNLSPGYTYLYFGNTAGNGTDTSTSCGSAQCACTNIGSYTVGSTTTAIYDDGLPSRTYTFNYRDIANNTTISNSWLSSFENGLTGGYKGSDVYFGHNDIEGTDNLGFGWADGTADTFTVQTNHTSPVCSIYAENRESDWNNRKGSGTGTKILVSLKYYGGSDPGAWIFTLRNSGIFIK